MRTKASASPHGSTKPPSGGPAVPKNESLVDVLSSLGVGSENSGNKVAFVEPRGLVNTGNMCYMNSVSTIWWLFEF